MSKYLLKEVKTFKADTEGEANQLIQHFKTSKNVTSHAIIRKDKKDETYFIVQLVISENLEKDPSEAYILGGE